MTSLEKLNLLHPKLRSAAIAAYNESVAATPKGVHPVIDESLRTFKRSDDLYAQPHDGKDNDGDHKIDEADEKVTNAPGGYSLHNYGMAIDFHLVINGKDIWPERPDLDKNWMTVVNIFKKHGFTWGADWDNDGKTRAQGDKDENLVDAPHLENRFGYKVSQLLAKYNKKDFIPGTIYVKI